MVDKFLACFAFPQELHALTTRAVMLHPVAEPEPLSRNTNSSSTKDNAYALTPASTPPDMLNSGCCGSGVEAYASKGSRDDSRSCCGDGQSNGGSSMGAIGSSMGSTGSSRGTTGSSMGFTGSSIALLQPELVLDVGDFWSATADGERWRLDVLEEWPWLKEMLLGGRVWPEGVQQLVKWVYPMVIAMLFLGPQVGRREGKGRTGLVWKGEREEGGVKAHGPQR